MQFYQGFVLKVSKKVQLIYEKLGFVKVGKLFMNLNLKRS